MTNKELLYKEQKKFNLGALFGSWLWGFCNRVKHWTVYVSFIIFILSFTDVRYMGITGVILAIYMGFVGSDLAYNNSDAYYTNVKEFVKVQQRWAGVFISIFAALVLAAWICKLIYGQQPVIDFLKHFFL